MVNTNNSNSADLKIAIDSKVSSFGDYTKRTQSIRLLIFLKCEQSQKELTDYLISSDEFTFDISTNLQSCLLAATQESHDVLVTDFCDFNLDVNVTITNFKDRSNELAIIFLTQNTDLLDEIEYLNQGADYVIPSPFKPLLIFARIKAVMRWRNSSPYSASQIGPFEFDMEAKRLSTQQLGDIRVTGKEARILQFLLSRKGEIVSRADLLQHIWGYNNPLNTHTIETHIYRLRKKIGKFADSKSIIITEEEGYRLAK